MRIYTIKPNQGTMFVVNAKAGDEFWVLLDIGKPSKPVSYFQWMVRYPDGIRIWSHRGWFQLNEWANGYIDMWVAGPHEGRYWKPEWDGKGVKARALNIVSACLFRAEKDGTYPFVVDGFKLVE